MEIRRFAKKDLVQVLAICNEVRNYHREILGGYFTEQDDYFEQQGFLNSLDDNTFIALVAEDNEVILGYLLAEKKYAPHLECPKVVHIANFGVIQTKRHQGIGKRLMDTLLDMCKTEEIDEIKLGVYNKNASAYKFYETYGFKPLEQRMHIQLNKK